VNTTRKIGFLFVFFALLLGFSALQPAYAPTATIEVTPSTLIVNPQPNPLPVSFNVNITVTNVIDAAGWQVALSFNASILQLDEAIIPADNIFGTSYIAPTPQIDNAGGKVVFGASISPGSPTFNGTGKLGMLVFNGTAEGVSALTLIPSPATFYTYIYDSNINDIPATLIDGTVTVVPEFPSILVIPLVIVIATTATILGKKIQQKRR